MTGLDVFHRLADALHRHGAFGGVVAGKRIDGDEIGHHAANFTQNHIHHELVVGPMGADDVNHHHSINGAKGVIAHRDKRSLGQVVQHLAVVIGDGGIQVLKYACTEGDAWRVAVVAVNPVGVIHVEQVE